MTNILFDASSVVPEDLQYYALCTRLLGSLDTKNYSKDELTTMILRYLNGFNVASNLTPKVRHEIGAYDNIVSFSENGLILLSYRDPSIVETNKVYDELDEFMLNTKVADKELESYIISA